MTQVKSDVLSFGVLLLRLFCRRSAPEDDRNLIEWVSRLLLLWIRHAWSLFIHMLLYIGFWQARPFLLEGVFPELLGEDHSEDVDTLESYRIFCAAEKCTKTKPDSRPCMSEVVNLPNPLWIFLLMFFWCPTWHEYGNGDILICIFVTLLTQRV